MSQREIITVKCLFSPLYSVEVLFGCLTGTYNWNMYINICICMQLYVCVYIMMMERWENDPSPSLCFLSLPLVMPWLCTINTFAPWTTGESGIALFEFTSPRPLVFHLSYECWNKHEINKSAPRLPGRCSSLWSGKAANQTLRYERSVSASRWTVLWFRLRCESSEIHPPSLQVLCYCSKQEFVFVKLISDGWNHEYVPSARTTSI